MTRIVCAEDIKKLGTILSIWAHPDDESFSCAGIMSAAISNGQKVICVTATKGELGVQDESRWPADKLGDIRTLELEAALVKLGIAEHIWLKYEDGNCCNANFDQAISQIREIIEQYKPDTILTFGPDGMTGHLDHQTVSKWVDVAAGDSDINIYHAVEEEERYLNVMLEADKKFNIYFNIDKPPTLPKDKCDIAIILEGELLKNKIESLKLMPSQTERMFNTTPAETMAEILGQEYFILVK